MAPSLAPKSRLPNRTRVRRMFAQLPILSLVLMSPGALAQNGPVSMVSSADNRFEFFLPWSTGIRHFWQNADGSWTVDGALYKPKPAMLTDVSPFGPSIAYRQTTASARDASGRLMVAWIANGRVYVATAPGAGTSLTPTGVRVGGFTNANSLAIAQNADGRLELFVLSKFGYLSSYPQTRPGAWEWSYERPLSKPGLHLRNFSVTRFRDGRLAVAAVTKANGRVVMTRQSGPNGTPLPGDTSNRSWTAWEEMGGHSLHSVMARESLDHRLELVALGGDAIVYHRYETSPNNWTEWGPISAEKVCGPVQFFSNSAGRMEIAARRCSTNEVVHVAQVAPNGGWATTWSPLIPNMRPSLGGPIAVALSPNGKLGILDYRIDNGRYFSVQTGSVNGLPTQWSPWIKVSGGN